jgi:hypothetical protein
VVSNRYYLNDELPALEMKHFPSPEESMEKLLSNRVFSGNHDLLLSIESCMDIQISCDEKRKALVDKLVEIVNCLWHNENPVAEKVDEEIIMKACRLGVSIAKEDAVKRMKFILSPPNYVDGRLSLLTATNKLLAAHPKTELPEDVINIKRVVQLVQKLIDDDILEPGKYTSIALECLELLSYQTDDSRILHQMESLLDEVVQMNRWVIRHVKLRLEKVVQTISCCGLKPAPHLGDWIGRLALAA